MAFKQLKPSDAIKRGKRRGGKTNKDLFIFSYFTHFFSYLKYVVLFLK